MKKLSRSFEASAEQESIKIEGQWYSLANLKKSGVVNQSVILIGQEDKWQEIEVQPLGLSNNITDLKNKILSGNITPLQIGIYTEVSEMTRYDILKHSDFEKLEKMFPSYPYYMISKLFRHISANGRKSNYYDLLQFMKVVKESGLTIPQWIMKNENENHMFVEKAKKGEPYTQEISTGIISIKYFITCVKQKYNFQVQSFKTGVPGSWSATSTYSFDTIKQAEHAALSEALTYMRSVILKYPSDNQYKELFTKIQNKFKIINMSETIKERENQLTSLGLMYNSEDHSYTGHGFTVTGNSIENDNEEEWALIVENIQDYLDTQKNSDATEMPAAPVPQQGGSTESRVKQLTDLGLKFDLNRNFSAEINGRHVAVDILDIQTYSDRKWDSVINDINRPAKTPAFISTPETESDVTGSVVNNPPAPTQPIPATPEQPAEKKPISLAVIGGIKPDRITELRELETSQLAVLDKHPFIKVTDAATLKKAKASVTALRKASTGTEKIEKDASKFLNTLKTAIKTVVDKAAGLTRTALDKQEQEVKEYENAEALRVAEEQRKKLEKIKQRTDSLFSAGMIFQGAAYNIGTLYVMPSQIEESTDDEFSALVQQAKDIKAELDAEKARNMSVEEQLAAAKAMIAKLTGTAPAAPAPASVAEITEQPTAPSNPETTPAPSPTPTPPVATPEQPAQVKPGAYAYNTEYIKPDPENYLLAKFDMEDGNIQAVNAKPIPPAFIKGRALYDRGLKTLAGEIKNILSTPVTEGGMKQSAQIAMLCDIILKQK